MAARDDVTRLASGELLGPAVDKYALDDLPDIDCLSILPVCKAACCRLTPCLSRQDLDEGELAWREDRPYQIRKKDDGWCAYTDDERRCTVYARRPAMCRTFDCRGDKRIWVDFARRIPRDPSL